MARKKEWIAEIQLFEYPKNMRGFQSVIIHKIRYGPFESANKAESFVENWSNKHSNYFESEVFPMHPVSKQGR